MEAQDVFADDVHISRPEFAERFRFDIRVSHTGEVVGQRVDPHVHDVLVIAWNRHTPVKRGARNRKVLQSLRNEPDDFVAARVRSDEFRVLFVELEQFVLVGRQTEEVGLFFCPFDFRARAH